MKYAIDKYDNFVVIEPLTEYLDGEGANKLKMEFLLRNNSGQRNIVLDMTHVKHTDEVGIRVGILANRLCRTVKGVFVLIEVRESILEFLKLCRLERAFLIMKDIAEAKLYILENDRRQRLEGGDR